MIGWIKCYNKGGNPTQFLYFGVCYSWMSQNAVTFQNKMTLCSNLNFARSDCSRTAEFWTSDSVPLLFFSNTSFLRCWLCQTLGVLVYPFASHFSSLHMSWSQRPPPPPTPTFSRVLRARQLWKQCGIRAAHREKGSLLYLPILTRFSRDIRGNKRCGIPALCRSKRRLDNFDARFTLNRGRTFWMVSLRLKWGNTSVVHKFAFIIAVFSIHNKKPVWCGDLKRKRLYTCHDVIHPKGSE